MAYKHQDFKVFHEQDTQGRQFWRVRSGGEKGDVATSCSNLEDAKKIAHQLNLDPWFLDRGFTRKERADG